MIGSYRIAVDFALRNLIKFMEFGAFWIKYLLPEMVVRQLSLDSENTHERK